MAEEQARLHEHQGTMDLRDLEELTYGYEPCYTIRIDYRQPAAIWVAIPADGGKPITADSAAALRAKLRLAAPVNRGAP